MRDDPRVQLEAFWNTVKERKSSFAPQPGLVTVSSKRLEAGGIDPDEFFDVVVSVGGHELPSIPAAMDMNRGTRSISSPRRDFAVPWPAPDEYR